MAGTLCLFFCQQALHFTPYSPSTGTPATVTRAPPFNTNASMHVCIRVCVTTVAVVLSCCCWLITCVISSYFQHYAADCNRLYVSLDMSKTVRVWFQSERTDWRVWKRKVQQQIQHVSRSNLRNWEIAQLESGMAY